MRLQSRLWTWMIGDRSRFSFCLISIYLCFRATVLTRVQRQFLLDFGMQIVEIQNAIAQTGGDVEQAGELLLNNASRESTTDFADVEDPDTVDLTDDNEPSYAPLQARPLQYVELPPEKPRRLLYVELPHEVPNYDVVPGS